MEGLALVRPILLYALFPLWMAASVGDWLCHRATRIETTSGTTESWLHLAQAGEIAIGVLAVLLLEIDAAVFALLAVVVLAHTATAYVDFAYTDTRRPIGPLEQLIHAFLVCLPLTIFVLLAVAHADEALAAIGLGDASADWGLRMKDPPLPWTTIAGVLGASALFVALPLAEEHLRCARVARQRRA